MEKLQGIIRQIADDAATLNEASASLSAIAGQMTDGVENMSSRIVATIATAVEEQAATSQEIAYNVAQASQGIQEVNQNVNQSSTVAGNIAGDITAVNASVQEIADSSSQVNQNADELSALAEKLRGLVGRFKVG
jgi:methyl-accepting chemotaxis protein